MVGSISSEINNFPITRKRNSIITSQRSFQGVLSGYDISNMDTIHKVKSFTSGSLLDKAELILPSFDNLRKMTSQLNKKLSKYLGDLGINSTPPFDIKMNYSNNSIEVTGDRDDLERIEKLLNDNTEIRNMVHDINAIGSHIINMADSLAFQKEYLSSKNPESVVSKYSYLFNDNREMQNFSLRFDGHLEILSDDEEWSFIPFSLLGR